MPLPAIIAGFAGRRLATRALTGASLGSIGFSLGRGGGGGGDRRRRRRRRALTASDRADIAYIASTISKAEAGRFASQLIAGMTR